MQNAKRLNLNPQRHVPHRAASEPPPASALRAGPPRPQNRHPPTAGNGGAGLTGTDPLRPRRLRVSRDEAAAKGRRCCGDPARAAAPRALPAPSPRGGPGRPPRAAGWARRGGTPCSLREGVRTPEQRSVWGHAEARASVRAHEPAPPAARPARRAARAMPLSPPPARPRADAGQPRRHSQRQTPPSPARPPAPPSPRGPAPPWPFSAQLLPPAGRGDRGAPAAGAAAHLRQKAQQQPEAEPRPPRRHPGPVAPPPPLCFRPGRAGPGPFRTGSPGGPPRKSRPALARRGATSLLAAANEMAGVGGGGGAAKMAVRSGAAAVPRPGEGGRESDRVGSGLRRRAPRGPARPGAPAGAAPRGGFRCPRRGAGSV